MKSLIEKIIPEADYQHRNGFNNIPIINSLSDKDKLLLENELIEKLIYESELDLLIIETLTYLKSKKSVPLFYKLLSSQDDNLTKLIIASCIFQIDSSDKTLIDIAIESLKKIDNKNDSYYVYKLTQAFYYLTKFKSTKIKSVLKEYINHENYLISYNAKVEHQNC